MKKTAIFILIVFVISSCSKMNDNIKEYIDRGEISYIGKADSVIALSGKERILFKWKVNTDPRIEQCWIYWNNYRDSISFPLNVSFQESDRYMSAELKISEGTYIFNLHHTGSGGYRSVREEVIGRSYGEIYEQSLTNSIAKSIEYAYNGDIIIDWSIADDNEVGIQLDYTDMHDNNRTMLVSNTETSTIISDFNPDNPLYYTTMYKPDTSAIDTFYTPKIERWIPIPDEINITSLFLKNTYAPFIRGAQVHGDRFYLAEDWIVNDAAAANGNIDVLSTGENGQNRLGVWTWAGYSPINPVVNAKLYQTVELEAGIYRFDAFLFLSAYEIDDGIVNVVASLGNDLPDEDHFGDALGFDTVPYGVSTTATSKPKISIEFVLTGKSFVSLGFVANISGEVLVFFDKVELWKKIN